MLLTDWMKSVLENLVSSRRPSTRQRLWRRVREIRTQRRRQLALRRTKNRQINAGVALVTGLGGRVEVLEDRTLLSGRIWPG